MQMIPNGISDKTCPDPTIRQPQRIYQPERVTSDRVGGKATSGVSGYSVDALFRSDHIDASASNQDVAAQASRILANGVRNGDVPPGDRTYLAQLVAAKTGIPQADAQKRVDDTIASTKEAETKARQAADAARKATANLRDLHSTFADDRRIRRLRCGRLRRQHTR
jgi:hypothetical protein